MSRPEQRYWDSNCFLAWIRGEAGRAGVCDEILRAAHKGECVIVTSTITLAEVVRPRRKGALELTEADDARIVAFFRSPFLKFVEFTSIMGQQARQLQWRHNLHVRDAIHVVSALFAKVAVIESYDSDLLRLDRASIPDCPEIRLPRGDAQASLLLGSEPVAHAAVSTTDAKRSDEKADATTVEPPQPPQQSLRSSTEPEA